MVQWLVVSIMVSVFNQFLCNEIHHPEDTKTFGKLIQVGDDGKD